MHDDFRRRLGLVDGRRGREGHAPVGLPHAVPSEGHAHNGLEVLGGHNVGHAPAAERREGHDGGDDEHRAELRVPARLHEGPEAEPAGAL